LQVQWTEKANRNLDEVEAYIAQDNPDSAMRVVLKVIRSVEQLPDSPGLGRPGRILGTRELVIGGTPFLVPYRVRGEVIEILAVLHGAMKWPTRL
jgi:toxin ParE1/3/4